MFESMCMDLETVWDSTSYGLLVLVEMHCIVEWQQGINLLFNKDLWYFFPKHRDVAEDKCWNSVHMLIITVLLFHRSILRNTDCFLKYLMKTVW